MWFVMDVPAGVMLGEYGSLDTGTLSAGSLGRTLGLPGPGSCARLLHQTGCTGCAGCTGWVGHRAQSLSILTAHAHLPICPLQCSALLAVTKVSQHPPLPQPAIHIDSSRTILSGHHLPLAHCHLITRHHHPIPISSTPRRPLLFHHPATLLTDDRPSPGPAPPATPGHPPLGPFLRPQPLPSSVIITIS